MHPILLVMILPRFRTRNRGNSLRPVNRIKHVVDAQLGIVLNTQSINILVNTVDNPAIADTNEVATGSTVNAIYLNLEAYATTAAALANVYMMVFKNPGNNQVFPNANVVGSNDNKRYVIHQEMKMLEQSVNGNPRTIFNGVIVIPRGYRRNGPDDALTLAIFAPGVNISACFQCHYKEFR